MRPANQRSQLSTLERGAALLNTPHCPPLSATRAPELRQEGTSRDNPDMPDEFMQAAIAEAEAGAREGGVPIGSVLVHDGRIVGRGHNRRVQLGSAIRHAEMDALENAGRQPSVVYRTSVLYTTLSPCAMCSGAILLYGIPKVIAGENQTFVGEEALLRSRGVALEVRDDPVCIDLMRRFIRDYPQLWNEDIGR